MAELNVSVLKSRERGSGEMEEQMETTSDSAIAHEHSEYVTTFEDGMPSSTCTTSVEERRAYRVWLEQEVSQWRSEEELLTAISKPTWTEVAPVSSCTLPIEKHEIQVTNQQFLKDLIKKQFQHRRMRLNRWIPTKSSELERLLETSGFFIDFGGRLDVGKKIAQGGQAEIYETLFDGENAIFDGDSLVLKVFPLEHLERFQHAWGKESMNIYMQYNDLQLVDTCCFVMNCTLLKDGRFAFLMRRYWGDLRKAINEQILKDKTNLKPPCPPSISTNIMFQIALGMNVLHRRCTLHRDLKAANVLVRCDIETYTRQLKEVGNLFYCDVADFECVEGVMGTRFWRAPEVLGILNSSTKDKDSDPTIWTEKVDVYAYGMTCYEVLSGCIPFQFRCASDYNIGDERPPLPDYVDQEIQELVRKCWDSDPLNRPTFETILNELRRFVGKKMKCCSALAMDERDDEAMRWVNWPFQYIDESGATLRL